MKLQIGIILRLSNGTPPVVLGAVANDELLALVLRSAVVAAERGGHQDAVHPDRLLDGHAGRVM